MDMEDNSCYFEQPSFAFALSKDDLINDPRVTAYICQIFEIVAVPSPHFQTLYLSSIANYLSLTQHCQRNNILTRLQTITDGLKLRRTLILPIGASPETANDKSDIWTYAIFTSLLLYNVAQEILGFEVMISTSNNTRYRKWYPLTEPLEPPRMYKVTRTLPTSPHASIALIPIIVDETGLQWLSDDSSILNTILDLIISPSRSDPLSRLICNAIGMEKVDASEPAKSVSDSKVTTPTPTKRNTASKNGNAGRQFQRWLMAELGKTTANPNIVCSENGTYLIDPDIFILCAKEQQLGDWKTIRTEFLNLGLHTPNPTTQSPIHTLRIPNLGKRDTILITSIKKR